MNLNAENPSDSKQERDIEAVDAVAAEPTMESLLQQQANFHERLDSRVVVWVKCVQVSSDAVRVDIGEKQDGVIPVSDFPQGQLPSVGARVPVVLAHRGGDDRPATLSHKKARWHLGWEQALKSFQEKTRVRGRVVSAVKGGFLVDVAGVSAFLPSSLADLRPVRKPETLLNTGVRCYILEINEDKKQLVLSRKAVLEEESRKRWDQLAAKLKIGAVVIGRAAHVGASGVVVNLGGVEGFVPESDLAWKEPQKAKSGVAHGQKFKMKILGIDTEARKITLGVKQLTPNPADLLKKKYPAKTVVKGKVVSVHEPSGVRIAVTDQVYAFCGASELPSVGEDPSGRARPEGGKGGPPRVVWPAQGQAVQAVVLGVNAATFELSVSMRRYEEAQDRKRIAKYLKQPPPLTLGQLLTPEGEL
ncbi:MAG: S1 RNA-binding domain-containing protein [Elusimicrobia bacterium]|nr:S1 RNA-binding domain-containing protein [Elusimicrobiota bacterium]